MAFVTWRVLDKAVAGTWGTCGRISKVRGGDVAVGATGVEGRRGAGIAKQSALHVSIGLYVEWGGREGASWGRIRDMRRH
jgi:hypothetical protein